MAHAGGKDRGIYFVARPHGEAVGPRGVRGEWWTCWFDCDGRKHREKAAIKSMAVDLHARRRGEVRKDLFDDLTLLDGCDDPHGSVTAQADEGIDVVHLPDGPRPGVLRGRDGKRSGVIKFVLTLALTLSSTYALAQDPFSCSSSARGLKNAADDFEMAYSSFESAKSSYESACGSYGYSRHDKSACGAYGYVRSEFKSQESNSPE